MAGHFQFNFVLFTTITNVGYHLVECHWISPVQALKEKRVLKQCPWDTIFYKTVPFWTKRALFFRWMGGPVGSPKHYLPLPHFHVTECHLYKCHCPHSTVHGIGTPSNILDCLHMWINIQVVHMISLHDFVTAISVICYDLWCRTVIKLWQLYVTFVGNLERRFLVDFVEVIRL